jgi:hypothetical protein
VVLSFAGGAGGAGRGMVEFSFQKLFKIEI